MAHLAVHYQVSKDFAWALFQVNMGLREISRYISEDGHVFRVRKKAKQDYESEEQLLDMFFIIFLQRVLLS